jgi:hypothetical protein
LNKHARPAIGALGVLAVGVHGCDREKNHWNESCALIGEKAKRMEYDNNSNSKFSTGPVKQC